MRYLLVVLVGLTQLPGSLGSATAQAATLTVYSGRTRELIEPLFAQFMKATGIQVRVRYGETAELAATILEEGQNSPADVYFAQDAGALGALAYAGRLRRLPDGVLQKVESRFQSSDGAWVGVSGRARVVVYNTRRLTARDLPASLQDFTQPRWRGRIGWAPTNGSFRAHVS